MNECERVKEKINQYVHQCNLELLLDSQRLGPSSKSNEIDSVFEPIYAKWTGEILSIEGLVILADDQTPLYKHSTQWELGSVSDVVYHIAQQDMLQDNFRRVAEKTTYQVGLGMKEEK